MNEILVAVVLDLNRTWNRNWSNGVLECWSNAPRSLTHHSTTPILQYSILLYVSFFMNGDSRSTGTGKMMVEFFSDAISTRLWRKRSCKAIGLLLMTSAASASFCEA